jgi:hypothetical protein
MFKLVAVTALSTLAAAGLVLAATTAVGYVPGDVGLLSSVSAAAFIVGFLALLVALLERTKRRTSGPAGSTFGGRSRDDRDMVRTLDELRAMNGTAGAAPARHRGLRTM